MKLRLMCVTGVWALSLLCGCATTTADSPRLDPKDAAVDLSALTYKTVGTPPSFTQKRIENDDSEFWWLEFSEFSPADADLYSLLLEMSKVSDNDVIRLYVMWPTSETTQSVTTLSWNRSPSELAVKHAGGERSLKPLSIECVDGVADGGSVMSAPDDATYFGDIQTSDVEAAARGEGRLINDVD